MCLLSTSLPFYLFSSLIWKYFFSIKNHRQTVHLWQIIDFLDYSDILSKSPVYWGFLRVVVDISTLSFKLFTISSNFWTTLLKLILVGTEVSSYPDMINPPLLTEVKKSYGRLSLTNSLVDYLKSKLWCSLSPIPFWRWFKSLD